MSVCVSIHICIYIYICIYICIYIYIYIYMGQFIEKRTIGAGQAKKNLTITLNNFITLEEQLIPFV